MRERQRRSRWQKKKTLCLQLSTEPRSTALSSFTRDVLVPTVSASNLILGRKDGATGFPVARALRSTLSCAEGMQKGLADGGDPFPQ